MSSNRIILSLSASSKPLDMLFLRFLERVSLRPKTSTTLPIIAFLGLCSIDWVNWKMIRSKEPRRKREPLLWDFFDPQGHHPIKF